MHDWCPVTLISVFDAKDRSELKLRHILVPREPSFPFSGRRISQSGPTVTLFIAYDLMSLHWFTCQSRAHKLQYWPNWRIVIAYGEWGGRPKQKLHLGSEHLSRKVSIWIIKWDESVFAGWVLERSAPCMLLAQWWILQCKLLVLHFPSNFFKILL